MTAVRKRPLIFSTDKMRRFATDVMYRQFLHLRARRKTRATTAEEYYGFRPQDVTEIYLRKHGTGRGVWYRLRDGRVFDALGRPSERERAWYVTSVH